MKNKSLKIHEVGPRDGLQMEKQVVDTNTKIAWIKELAKSGMEIIQIGSFVHPKYVPQMADTDTLFSYFNQPENKLENVILSGLVLNEKGYERGMACGVDMFCMGVSASETHSNKNTRMGTNEAITRIIPTAKLAREAGKQVQLSVQSAFGCGFEGPIAEERVENIVKQYMEAGFYNISLADTAGHADPEQIKRLFSRIKELDSQLELTGHFHNTYAMAIANSMAAIEAGVNTLESSFAGLGGCPFTSVAGGNVATEDLVHMLQRMGMRTDIDLEPIIDVAEKSAELLGRELPGLIYKTGGIAKNIKGA